MLVSIIIPTYNRAHLIGETLDSILAQTYTNWECLIVDDGSTDNTAQVLQTYLKDTRFKYHKRPSNKTKGPNSCRNFGFKLTKGDFIKWFDSDDVMYDNLLEKQLLSITANSDCSVCKIVHYNFKESKVLSENNIFSSNSIEDYLIGKLAFYVSGPLWRRQFLKKQDKLFDESISNLDDWDFNLRMLYSKPNIVFVNEVLIQYRVHNNSLSHEINKLNIAEIDSEFFAREKHINLLEVNKLVDSLILKRFIIERYKFLLREALVNKNKLKFYLLKKTLQKQLQVYDVNGFSKTIVGFSFYAILNKGYKFLK